MMLGRCDSHVRLLGAVFTQGEKGLQVTGIFLVFAVGLHLIEAVRNSAQKKSNGKSSHGSLA